MTRPEDEDDDGMGMKSEIRNSDQIAKQIKEAARERREEAERRQREDVEQRRHRNKDR